MGSEPADLTPDRNGSARLARRFDALWWFIAGAAAVAVQQLPRTLSLDPDTQHFMRLAGFFVVGAIVGGLRSDRAWRWAVAAFIAFAFADLLHLGTAPQFPDLTVDDFMRHARAGMNDWLLSSGIVLAGAFTGAYLIGRGFR